ncbi:MAG: hypothetical protein R6U02_01440 [Alkalibacterium sp.]|uniref:hypothetical protein n=1 Tax=Alkalibacterium sp. TaxID=1872447 RepID=UPI0039710E84
MIDRYIYAVTRELPEKSRKKVTEELRVLIDYRLEKTDKSLSEEEKIEKVLRDLGDPRELANRFRGRERYLIGPKYYYKYLFVLKLVVIAIVVGISVVSGLGAVFSTESTSEVFGGYIISLFSAVLQGVVWVTGIFALLEYNEISLEPGVKHEEWIPSKLPALPAEKARISRVGSIFSIIFSTIFLILFFFFYDKIGIYYRTGSDFSFIPLFNMQGIYPVRAYIFLIFIINITIELIKIIKGRWTNIIAVIITALNIVSAALFIYIINSMNIWNAGFIQRFEQYMAISFERMIVFTTIIIIIVTLAESLSALFKGFKYG